ncbi:MAG: MarR family transcriptional regulator [Corynebacterium sp.]|nr:MarR family transcriptional regulator [Corynebacterium sp.]
MNYAPRWLNDEEQGFWRQYLAAANKIDRVIDDSLHSNGALSAPEYAVMVALSEAEGRQLRLRELCTELNWDRSRTSHQITRMEKRGFVAKEKSEGDARGVMVSLTDEGMRRLEEAVPEHVETVRRLIFDHLDPQDVPALQRFFTNVLAVNSIPSEEK